MRKTNPIIWASALALLSAAAGCSDEQSGPAPEASVRISAVIEDPQPESRTCIDGATATTGSFVGMLWTPGDKIGAFGDYDSNVPFTNEATENARKTSFSGTPSGMIRYAYHPWSAANDGRDPSSLAGVLPAEQKLTPDHRIEADYKYGVVANGELGTDVRFNHLLSLVRLTVDGRGTALSTERVESVELSAERDGQPVGLAGDFTFSAIDGSLTTGDLTPGLKAVWTDPVGLNQESVGFISMFPNLLRGDRLTVKISTAMQTATFTATLAKDFRAGYVYNFPLTLKAYEGKPEFGLVYEPVQNALSGTFTAATYNVDGLPAIINSDGPGKDGTKLLGEKIASDAVWDFFGVSENFDYNDNLWGAISGVYDQGTYRKATLGLGTADTDGLNFFWRKEGITVSNETFVEYNEKAGGLTDGANTSIKKGFRYYLVTMADGVQFDVYITHMNTYSDKSTSHINAQHSQLEQLRDYVMENLSKNKRPAIVMGDTNMRYTRHRIEELLVDRINADSRFTFNDPWVDFQWDGKYPAYPSNSLMVSDATGTSDTDIICPSTQQGEVVDKIWYVNTSESDVVLKAESYLRDTSYVKADGKTPLADHYPIVVRFSYIGKK